MTGEDSAMFRRACLPTTVKVCQFLNELENEVADLELPDGVGPEVAVAGSVLLLLLGMMTDPDGGREDLLLAATLLGKEHPLPRDEIRSVIDEVFNRMEITFTDHLHN